MRDLTGVSLAQGHSPMSLHPQRPPSRREACEYLLENHGIRRSPGTLAKQACLGGGPGFQSVGRSVIYQPKALDVMRRVAGYLDRG
jgi:hypothetical protein